MDFWPKEERLLTIFLRTEAMATLSPVCAFGIKASVKNVSDCSSCLWVSSASHHRLPIPLFAHTSQNVAYIDENTILYVAGSQLVLFNTDNRSQKFLSLGEGCGAVTCIALAPSRRLLAVAHAANPPATPGPTIAVYDLHALKRRKLLTDAECKASEYACMAFSADSKDLITQSAAPEWALAYWTWEKSRGPWATTKPSPTSLPVTTISLNPSDSTNVCVSGQNVFKLYRFADNSLKQLAFQKLDQHHFRSHAWLGEDRIIAGTANGHLLLLEAGELKNEFSLFPDDKMPADTNVEFLVPYSRGFICAAGGSVHIFDKADDSKQYKKQREEVLPTDLPVSQFIKSISVSPSEDYIAVVTNQSQLYTMVLSHTDQPDILKVCCDHMSSPPCSHVVLYS